MSPWLRKTLEIGLAPDAVTLRHCRPGFAFRGEAEDETLLPVLPGGATEPWQGALQTLASALEKLARPTRARVVLSSRLVRYAVVPWSDALSDPEEEMAFARHCFERLYGDAVAQWTIRVSAGTDGAPMLASAVDSALLDRLREVLAAKAIALESIQPNLMSVCNAHRRRLGRHAWLALLEPGQLCLALLHQGHWVRVRSLRIGPQWQNALPLILARETYLTDPQLATADVFLWAAQRDAQLPDDARWNFHQLSPFTAVPGESAPEAGLATTAAES